MPKTILNFNIETTGEKLTPRTGVAIFGEYLKGLQFERLCNTNIPKFIYPLILMLHSGGRVLDDHGKVTFFPTYFGKKREFLSIEEAKNTIYPLAEYPISSDSYYYQE